MKLHIESLKYELAGFRTPLKFGASVVTELVVPVVMVRLRRTCGCTRVGAQFSRAPEVVSASEQQEVKRM